LSDTSENKKTTELNNTGDYKLQKSGKLNKQESISQIEFFTVGRAFKDHGWRCQIKRADECAILKDLHISNNQEPRQKVKRPPSPPAPEKTAAEKAQEKTETKLQSHQDQAAKKEEKLKAQAAKKQAAAQKPGLLTRLQKYLTEETQPKPITIDLKRIPPFDLQDIPDAMDTQKLAIAAKFMRKWFAGEANYASNKDGANKGITHDGKPYPASMIDETTITWKWVTSFPRVRDKVDELIRDNLLTSKSIIVLRKILEPYKNKSSYNCASEYNGSTHDFNGKFAFQNSPIDKLTSEKVKLYADIQKNEYPDEILGALGAFQINVAVGKFWCVNYYQDGETKGRLITIESIFLYVKDSFDFLDQEGVGSQYLGHWSHKGLYIAPIGKIGNNWSSSWIENALLMDGKSIYEKGAVMYPTSNKYFRNWREKHKQGGDFLIYSRPVEYKLDKEIKIVV
jgi:hypothetical protein